MEGNDKLEELLGQIVKNTDDARRLAESMGIKSGAPTEGAGG